LYTYIIEMFNFVNKYNRLELCVPTYNEKLMRKRGYIKNVFGPEFGKPCFGARARERDTDGERCTVV